MVTFHDVLLDTTDRIATVTLNRPEARNAFNGGILRGLYDAAAHILGDPSTSVVILTGAGEKAF